MVPSITIVASESQIPLFGLPPLVAKGQLHFLQWQVRVDAIRRGVYQLRAWVKTLDIRGA